MRRCVLIPFFILSFSTIFSQNPFSQEDFEYFSEIDRQLIETYFKDPTQPFTYLGLFVSSSVDATHETYSRALQEIELVLGEIKGSRPFKNGGEKLVNHIYKVVHQRFFDKYIDGASFLRIFQRKEYNCATASALYALIFHELGIPFEVNYSDDHVFLTVYPSNKPIIVETTNPISGTTSYSKSYMENYVSYLRKIKLISQSELQSKTTEALFFEHFFKARKGTIRTAAGILFYNECVSLLNKKDFLAAITMGIRTSYFLEGYEKSNYLILTASNQFLQQEEHKSPLAFAILGKLTIFTDDFVPRKDIISTLSWSFRQIAQNGDVNHLDKCYNSFISMARDSSLKETASFHYNKEKGRLHYINRDFNRALEAFDKALLSNREDKETEFLFLETLPYEVSKESIPDSSFKRFEYYFHRHLSLKDNTKAQLLRSSLILYISNIFFQEMNPKKGEEFLAIFSRDFPPTFVNLVSVDMFEKAIGEAAIYYFKKGQQKKAKEKAVFGLLYYPNSSYLRKVLSSLGG